MNLNDFCIPYRPLEDKAKRDLEKTIRDSNILLERYHEDMKRSQGISRHNRTTFLAEIKKAYKPGKDLEIAGVVIPERDASEIIKVKDMEWDVLCAYSRMIDKLAYKWCENISDGSLSSDDMKSEAVGAAINALSHYTKEERFSTYLHHCVNRHLSKVFNKTTGMSDLSSRTIKLRREYKRLECEEGATFDGIVSKMGISEKDAKLLRASLCSVKNITSLGEEGCEVHPADKEDDDSVSELDGRIFSIMNKIELSNFERAVLEGYLSSGGKTSASKSMINPETKKPYSRMACSYAWKRVMEKIEKAYSKAA
jgi:hypothetical protein